MRIENPIVFFDLETTGLSITNDRIVQIATIKIDLDGNWEEKVKMINPEIPISVGASEVHGITNEMVKDAPTFKQFAKSLKDYLQGCDFGGYNSDQFDFPLLVSEFERAGIIFPDWEPHFVDVLKIERKINSHKLDQTYKRYTGEELKDAHDALADVDATVTVLVNQLEILDNDDARTEKYSTAELDKLCQGDTQRFDYAGKCYIKDGEVYWSFGKHKDKPVSSDINYLNWVLKSDFPAETKRKLLTLNKS